MPVKRIYWRDGCWAPSTRRLTMHGALPLNVTCLMYQVCALSLNVRGLEPYLRHVTADMLNCNELRLHVYCLPAFCSRLSSRALARVQQQNHQTNRGGVACRQVSTRQGVTAQGTSGAVFEFWRWMQAPVCPAAASSPSVFQLQGLADLDVHSTLDQPCLLMSDQL